MSIPIVFLPGMMCDARLYAPQLAAFSGQHSVTVSPLGHHDTVQALAGDILRHGPPRFAMIGLSMGGIVAMEVMRQAPTRIDRLALFDTNPKAEIDEVAARRTPQMDKVRAGQLHAIMRDEMKPNYLTDGPKRDEILALCMDMASDLGAEVFLNQSKALRSRPDQCDVLRQLSVPTLIACGEDDRLCPVARHALMHSLIEGSRLEVIKGAGHLPTLEQPQITNALLREWLDA